MHVSGFFVFAGKVEDQSCKAEIYRMEELPNMYQNVYDRPFVLPSIVTSQLRLESEESESGVQREVSCFGENLKQREE